MLHIIPIVGFLILLFYFEIKLSKELSELDKEIKDMKKSIRDNRHRILQNREILDDIRDGELL